MNPFTALAFVLGSALITTGSALVYHPLGFIVGGGLILAVAFASSRSARKRTS